MTKKFQEKANLRLRRARELRGWSQNYLAEQLDNLIRIDTKANSREGCEDTRFVPASYISRWERGEVTPSPYYREKLCRIFNLNADKLGLLDYEVSSTNK